MTEVNNRKRLNQVLTDLADTLDVPPSKYQEAKNHYDAVSAWLGAEDSELASFEPVIYPQGSFASGTAVRPLGKDEYDVDAVCFLQLKAEQVTQQLLKAMVGARLKHPSSRYKDMIDPPGGGRRCWTIKYADSSKFHLDVLPAIPDEYDWLIALGVSEQCARHAIRITDRKTWDQASEWPRSNPKGYVMWFKDRMRVRLEEAKVLLALEKRAAIEEIEDFEVRTPLQRLIQVLKRHRDLRYNGDDDKPTSIIVTTLAAGAYNNESNLVDALFNVVPGMRRAITKKNGVLWVANPVNPLENFADRWQESPRKADLFFQWLDAVEREHRELLTDPGFDRVGQYLTDAYGQRRAEAVMAMYANRRLGKAATTAAGPVLLVPRKISATSQPAKPRIEVPSRPSRPWRP